MSYRTHRKRPTSIGNDLMFRAMNNINSVKEDPKAYVAADGQVLQSSMVKDGSPKKSQLTGSTSQVRFSLPPPPSSSSDDDESFSFSDGENYEDEHSFDNKPIFNLTTRELVNSKPKKDPNFMLSLLESSPDRHKLFIRPQSTLNDQQIPIPVELLLPPQLSPKNKRKSRPTSLIFNGSGYEPLESISSLQKPTTSVSKEILIPNLDDNTIQQLLPASTFKSLNDGDDLNEKEIENPSNAAKLQNNNLNKSFSFPPEKPKDLPPLPPTTPSIHTHSSSETTLSGLQIYSEDDGKLKSLVQRKSFEADSLKEPFQFISNEAPRQSRPRQSKSLQSKPLQSKPLQSKPLQHKPLQFKPLPPAQQQQPLSRSPSKPLQSRPLQSKPLMISHDEPEVAQEVEEIEFSFDISSAGTSIVEDDETTQLFDLGDLIISSSSGLQVSESDIANLDKDLGIRHPESNLELNIIEEPVRPQSLELLPGRKRNIEQPLGSQFYQPNVYFAEADQFRSMKNKPTLSHSSYEESEVSEPFSAASTAETFASSLQSPTVIDLTNEDADYEFIKLKEDMNKFKTVLETAPDGELRETIVLDDEEDAQPIRHHKIRHQRSKSALANLEFEAANRDFSCFSFETVASEVQLHYKSSLESVGSKSGAPLSNYPSTARTYTEKNMSAVELCDDTMKNTKAVMDDLKRQKTLLINQQLELLRQKKQQEDRLENIKILQNNIVKSKQKQIQRERILQNEHINEKDKVQNDYFDYASGNNYDFHSFMDRK